MKILAGLVLFVLHIFLISSLAITGHSSSGEYLDRSSRPCKAWLVQSIPTDMPHLKLVRGVLSTADVFKWLAGNSSRSLDIIAQYWQLIARPRDPNSGDYGYSKKEMKKFGSYKGLEVYQALQDAADRNISMRFRLLQHSGVYPDYTEEPSNLASGWLNVKSLTLLLKDWYGSGVVHAKVWISDRRDVYIGSANNDWKSLTQVKEVGIYIADCPRIAKGVKGYFDNLWKLAQLNTSAYTRSVEDQQWQTTRRVPCWSRFINRRERCETPLEDYVKIKHAAGYPVLADPDTFHVAIEAPGTGYSTLQPQFSYLSFAPPELLFDRYQTDEQAWVDTIKSVAVGGTVRISTMHWLGQSEYMPIYWSTLSSAIAKVVYGMRANVKLLVAYLIFVDNTDQYLKSLLSTNDLCSSSEKNDCQGKVEIKYYIVPGFNQTGPAKNNNHKNQNHKSDGNIYPNRTRYSHGKYAVSDVRAHIGTSNLVWDHFYTNAGVSFGTYNPAIVSQLQKIFDADWDSPYAVPFEPVEQGHAYTM